MKDFEIDVASSLYIIGCHVMSTGAMTSLNNV